MFKEQEHKIAMTNTKWQQWRYVQRCAIGLGFGKMLKIKGIRDKISIPNKLQRFLSTYTTKPFGYQSEKYQISSFFRAQGSHVLLLQKLNLNYPD
jgi:hypothetical protein